MQKSIAVKEIKLKCPSDGTLMKKCHNDLLIIDKCPKCQGIWLDKGELEDLEELSRSKGASSAYMIGAMF